jgi:Holliday junction resolvasome RuvABC endonuclease subunit
MMKALLNITENMEYFDTTDALAIAVCHSNNFTSEAKSRSTTWSQFIKNNPEKILKL